MTKDSKAATAMAKEVSETMLKALKNEGIEAEATESASEETVAKNKKGEAKTVPTLRQIFGLPEKETDPADDRWKAIQKTLGKEVKGITMMASMKDLAPKVCELLDIEVTDVMLKAWGKVADLQEKLEESKKAPEKVIYLALAKHSMKHETRPFIDVKIRSKSVKKLTLTVLVELELKGFVLRIQNGAIKEIQAGECGAKGTIKYGELSIAEKKLGPIKLSFPIEIPDEIPSLNPGAGNSEEKAEAGAGVTAPEKELERIEL